MTDATADPRVAADVLGHEDTATTLRHYLRRGRVHVEVAELVEAAVKGGEPDFGNKPHLNRT